MNVAKCVSPDTFTSELANRAGAATSEPRLFDFGVAREGRLICPQVFVEVVRIADFAVAVSVGLVTAVFLLNTGGAAWMASCAALTIAAGVVLNAAFELLRLYRISSLATVASQTPRALLGCLVALCVPALCELLEGDDAFLCNWIAWWLAAGALGLLLERVAVSALAQAWVNGGKLERRALIVGAAR